MGGVAKVDRHDGFGFTIQQHICGYIQSGLIGLGPSRSATICGGPLADRYAWPCLLQGECAYCGQGYADVAAPTLCSCSFVSYSFLIVTFSAHGTLCRYLLHPRDFLTAVTGLIRTLRSAYFVLCCLRRSLVKHEVRVRSVRSSKCRISRAPGHFTM